MGLIGWAEEKIKVLSIWDIGVVKLYAMLFGAIGGAYFSEFVIS